MNTPFVVLLALIGIVLASFYAGMMWERIQLLEHLKKGVLDVNNDEEDDEDEGTKEIR